MKVDEDLYHPFTIARMTDHNVRGNDAAEKEPSLPEKPSGGIHQSSESKRDDKYRSPQGDSGEEYYFYKQNRELIDEARKKRR